MRVLGLKSLKRKIDALIKSAKDVSVVVGYSASYAIYVHELHRSKAKFLENPAREMIPDLQKTITTMTSRGFTLQQALMTAGLQLQRASQLLVPVRTGNLKASAYTRLEKAG